MRVSVETICEQFSQLRSEERFSCSGEHDVTKREGFEFSSRVKHFGYSTHNSYNQEKSNGVIEYDIAVLELEKPVDFTLVRHIR